MYNVYRTCVIGQLRAMVQAPVSGNEAHVAGWGRPAGPVVTSFGYDSSGCRRWWAGTVARPPSAGVERCACIGLPPLHHPSASFMAITSVRPCLLRTRETGWGRHRTYPPVSRTAVNVAHPWKLYTPPGIHVHCLCSDLMYVCHSIRRIRRTDRDNGTAVDIKAHTPLIRFVVDLLVCCI